MSIFFTSDTYFGVDFIRDSRRNKFGDIDIMNSVMIDTWNSTITPKDIVYVLGNFGDYEIIPRLNGRIVLMESRQEDIHFTGLSYMDKTQYFANKYGIAYIVDTVLDTDKPIGEDIKSLKLNLNPKTPSGLCDIKKTHCCNIYSDTCSNEIVTPYGINVSIDLHNMKPVELNTVLFYAKGLLNLDMLQMT